MEPSRRSMKNDILVAVVALVMVAAAVGIAAVLTQDSFASLTTTPTEQSIAIADVILSATAASASEILATTAPPTEQPATPLLSATPAPSATVPPPSPPALAAASPTATLPVTEAPPLASPSPIPSIAIEAMSVTATLPAATQSPAQPVTPKNTLPPPTSVPVTLRPTLPPSPTPVPASPTPFPTRIPASPTVPTIPPPSPTTTATETPAPLSTQTIPPSMTLSATATLTPTPLGILPTPTILLATPITPTAGAGGACVPPAGWQPYTVRSGENLFRISLRANIPLSQVQAANCIPDPARIAAGQVIYLPPAFFTAGGSGTGSGSGGQAGGGASTLPVTWGCSVPTASISAPAPGAILPLSASFSIRGTAAQGGDMPFAFYKVEIRREDESVFHNVAQSTTPVQGPGGLLATINPQAFGPGHYQIVLTVVDITGNYPEPCAIRVTLR